MVSIKSDVSLIFSKSVAVDATRISLQRSQFVALPGCELLPVADVATSSKMNGKLKDYPRSA